MPKKKRRSKERRQKAQVTHLDKKLHEEEHGKRPDRKKVAAVVRSSYQKARTNADAFVRSIFDPFEVTGVRIPSAGPTFGSGTQVLASRYALPVITASDTSKVSAAVFNANLKDHYYRAGTVASASDVTAWTSVDHSHYASLVSLAAAYRVVSFGIRIKDVGARLNQGAVLLIGHLPPETSTTAPAGNILTFMNVSDNIMVMRADETNPDDIELVWIPVTSPGTYINSRSHAGASTGGYTANAWRAPDLNSVDNRLVIYMYDNNANSTATDVIFVETIMNVETIFHQEDQYLQAPKYSPGDPSATAEAFTEAMQGMLKQGWADFLMTGVKKGSEHVGALFHNRKFQSHMAGLGGTLAASLFAPMSHPSHPLTTAKSTRPPADVSEEKSQSKSVPEDGHASPVVVQTPTSKKEALALVVKPQSSYFFKS